MRLLALIQGTKPEDQIGYHYAFLDMVKNGGLSSYNSIPYRALGISVQDHWRTVYNNALKVIREDSIDLLILQWFHGIDTDPRPFIKRAREIQPGIIVTTTCGDGFGRWIQRPPRSLRWAAAASDVTFLTSMGYMADILERSGAKNLVLMPHGACQVRFGELNECNAPEFDVVFVGSKSGGRNPFTPRSRCGKEREAMVERLTARYGKRFALFGRGWEGCPSWQGPVPYADQHKAAQRARIQVGGFPGVYATYYASDRFYIALASGVPLMDFEVDRVDRLAEPGRHWVTYQDMSSMLSILDRMLDRQESELTDLGANARQFVLEGHTQAKRAQEMVEIARSLRSARSRKALAEQPKLRCFHGGVDPISELAWAVRAWHG